jgi:hypothetical protein
MSSSAAYAPHELAQGGANVHSTSEPVAALPPQCPSGLAAGAGQGGETARMHESVTAAVERPPEAIQDWLFNHREAALLSLAFHFSHASIVP